VTSDRSEKIREIPRESRGNNEEALLPGGNPFLLPQVIPIASTVLKGRLFRFGQVCLTGADCSYGNVVPEFPVLSLVFLFIPLSIFVLMSSPRKPPFAWFSRCNDAIRGYNDAREARMSLTVPATITNFSPITFSIPPDMPESSCYSIQRDRNVITLALRKLQLPTVDLGGCCRSFNDEVVYSL